MIPFHKFNIIGFYLVTLISALILITSCSNPAADVQVPSQQDVELASNIIGESMSNDSGGLVSSMGDATTVVGRTGFGIFQHLNENSLPIGTENTDTLRGNALNYRVTYNPKTGTHTVDFERDVTIPRFSKMVKLHLEYIYRDSAGVFLQFPRQSEIFSVDFKGDRSGTVQTPSKKSDFSRIDTLFYNGLNRASTSITINGTHYGHGDFQMTTTNGDHISKVYDLSLKLLNVSIDKSSIFRQDLTTGVTGTLSYDLSFHKSNDTTAVDKHITGTINMNGDGTALLKFAHYTNRYLIDLKTGHTSVTH